MTKPSQKELCYLFSYDPFDPEGDLLRLVRTSNSVKVGDIAGTIHVNKKDGYKSRVITIKGKLFPASHLIWCWMIGKYPEHEIDHADQDATNNSWFNLRPATRSQNGANRKGWASSGIKGVYKRGRRFRAQIQVNGKDIHLGMYDTEEQASNAIKEAYKKYFGEFACFEMKQPKKAA